MVREKEKAHHSKLKVILVQLIRDGLSLILIFFGYSWYQYWAQMNYVYIFLSTNKE